MYDVSREVPAVPRYCARDQKLKRRRAQGLALETAPADVVKVVRMAEEDKGRKRNSGGNSTGKLWGMHVDEVRPACWKEMEVEVRMSGGHESIEVFRE
jgi:hypothetical protein